MIVWVQHLIGGRFERSRVAELGRLHARFRAQPGPAFADPVARGAAQQIARLKEGLAEAYGAARACSGCAKGCAAPAGVFDGGRCCGTATLDVFTQAEVRAMTVAGAAPPDRPAEDGAEGAGCLFRGRGGCSLPPASRPARCLVYVCHELRIELEPSGRRHERIQALRRELESTFARFEAHTR